MYGDYVPSELVAEPTGIGPQAPYLARPAPAHYGDYFGADQGYATVWQVSGGYDLVNGVQDADVAAIATRSSMAGARLNAPPPAANFLQTSGAGLLLLFALAYWFERTR